MNLRELQSAADELADIIQKRMVPLQQKFTGQRVILKHGKYRGREAVISEVYFDRTEIWLFVKIPKLDDPEDYVEYRCGHRLDEVELI